MGKSIKKYYQVTIATTKLVKVEYMVKAKNFEDVKKKMASLSAGEIKSVDCLSDLDIDHEYWLVQFGKFGMTEFYSKKNDTIGDIYLLRTLKNREMAKILFDQGLKKYSLQEYKKAIRDFDEAIDLYNRFAEAYLGRGKAKMKLNELASAFDDAEKAIKLRPKYDEAFVCRGKIKYDSRNEAGAIADYRKAIKINPINADAYSNLAISLYSEDQDGALEAINKALEIDPGNVETLINSGEIKRRKNDYEGAIQDYCKAIDLDLGNFQAYLDRGIVKEDSEDYNGAIQDYSKAIEINPHCEAAYLCLGFAKAWIDDNEGAIHAYNQLIEINPLNYRAYYHIGCIKRYLKDYLGAISYLNKAVEIDPKDDDLYFPLEHVQFALKDYYGAIQTVNQQIEHSYHFSRELYLIRGLLKYFIHDRTGEMEDYEIAFKNRNHSSADTMGLFIQNSPKDGNSKSVEPDFSEDVASYKSGRLKLCWYYSLDAIDDFSKSIEHNPKNVNSLIWRGLSQLEERNEQSALSDFNKAIEVDPHSPYGYFQRGRMLNTCDLFESGVIFHYAGRSDIEIAASMGHKGAIETLHEMDLRNEGELYDLDQL